MENIPIQPKSTKTHSAHKKKKNTFISFKIDFYISDYSKIK